jgi:ribosome-binding ATPase YchF (GTP1/OBG family)
MRCVAPAGGVSSPFAHPDPGHDVRGHPPRLDLDLAGPDEVRAWPVRDGSTAVDAAGAIHTDLARGFIRAETVAYDDLLTLGSMADARKAGRLRSEGKTYRVHDGDVVEILFSK